MCQEIWLKSLIWLISLERDGSLCTKWMENGGNLISYLHKSTGCTKWADTGFADLDLECSTVWLTLLGQMGIWQKRLCSWARWWNTEIKVNPTKVSAHFGHPVEIPVTEVLDMVKEFSMKGRPSSAREILMDVSIMVSPNGNKMAISHSLSLSLWSLNIRYSVQFCTLNCR